MTQNSKYAYWNIEDAVYIECDCCYNRLTEVESADPCMIDGRVFCDKCASNITQLRLDGYIGDVSAKTRALRISEDIFKTLGLILRP